MSKPSGTKAHEELSTSLRVSPDPQPLYAELRALIASSRQRLAGAVNAELTRLYWAVGKRLRMEVLGDARADYGAKLIEHLGQQLAQEFGRGFEFRNLRRMMKFSEAFPHPAIVSTLSTQLSWSHLIAIVALKNPQVQTMGYGAFSGLACHDLASSMTASVTDEIRVGDTSAPYISCKWLWISRTVMPRA